VSYREKHFKQFMKEMTLVMVEINLTIAVAFGILFLVGKSLAHYHII